MAIEGSFYASVGNDRPYYYYHYNEVAADLLSNGVHTHAASLTTEMQVSAVGGTMKSQVELGVAYMSGIRSVISVSPEEVTHDAADVSNARIDLIVLEANTDPSVRQSRIIIIKGTPAVTPAVPALTEPFQLPLAEVLIPAGAADSVNFLYTDKRVKAVSPIKISADNLDGVVDIEQGGTGATSAAGIRNALGLGNTTDALPVANGGTGATSASAARANLGLKNGAVATLSYSASTGTLSITV